MKIHARVVPCYGHVGYMGSGKTAALVRDCLIALRAGRPTYTNAGFVVVDHEKACEATGDKDCDCPVRSREYFSLEEIAAVPKGSFVAIDEAQNFVWSRNSSKFPRGVMQRLRYGRKDALTVAWSAVDEMDVDAALRRSTGYVIHNARWGRWRLFNQRYFAPIDKRRADDRPMRTRWYFMKKDTLRAYDTFAHNWMSPEVIEQIKDDVEKGWVPLTEGLSAAIMSRETDAIDRELAAAKREGREYQDRARAAERRACAPEAVPSGWIARSMGLCDACSEFRAVAYVVHSGQATTAVWLCHECVTAQELSGAA